MSDNKPTSSPELSWTAPEFEFFEKNFTWYAISLFIAVVFLGIAIWQKNLLFAVFIIVAESIILFFSSERPKDIKFKMSRNGLVIGSKSFHWTEFSSFSIEDIDTDDDFVSLHFYKANIISFDLKISVPAGDIAKTKTFLHNYLAEVEHQESLIDTISHFLRF